MTDEYNKMEAEIERLRDALETCRELRELDRKEIKRLRTERLAFATESEERRAALLALVADIEEYEQVNNIAPNPGKRDCWQSVTRAKALLGDV